MIKILYVHGYLGHKDGSASNLIRKELDRRNIEYSLDAPSVPITTPEEAINLIKTDDYDIIISSSMGSFYAMHNSGTFKILINPALTETLVALNGDYPENMLGKISKMENDFFENLDLELVDETYLVFGSKDEIAHNKEKFLNYYRTDNFYTVEDMPHKLNEGGAKKVVDVVENIINRIEKG